MPRRDRLREGAQSSINQPPGGLDTHAIDYYMRVLWLKNFNTLRITFNHGARCPLSRLKVRILPGNLKTSRMRAFRLR